MEEEIYLGHDYEAAPKRIDDAQKSNAVRPVLFILVTVLILAAIVGLVFVIRATGDSDSTVLSDTDVATKKALLEALWSLPDLQDSQNARPAAYAVAGFIDTTVTDSESITIEFSQPIIALGEDYPGSVVPEGSTEEARAIRLAPVLFTCERGATPAAHVSASFVPRQSWPATHILRIDVPPTPAAVAGSGARAYPSKRWPTGLACNMTLHPGLETWDGVHVAAPAAASLQSAGMTARVFAVESPRLVATRVAFDPFAWRTVSGSDVPSGISDMHESTRSEFPVDTKGARAPVSQYKAITPVAEVPCGDGSTTAQVRISFTDDVDVAAVRAALTLKTPGPVIEGVVACDAAATTTTTCVSVTLAKVPPRAINELVVRAGAVVSASMLPLVADVVVPFVGLQPARLVPGNDNALWSTNLRVAFPRGVFRAVADASTGGAAGLATAVETALDGTVTDPGHLRDALTMVGGVCRATPCAASVAQLSANVIEYRRVLTTELSSSKTVNAGIEAGGFVDAFHQRYEPATIPVRSSASCVTDATLMPQTSVVVDPLVVDGALKLPTFEDAMLRAPACPSFVGSFVRMSFDGAAPMDTLVAAMRLSMHSRLKESSAYTIYRNDAKGAGTLSVDGAPLPVPAAGGVVVLRTHSSSTTPLSFWASAAWLSTGAMDVSATRPRATEVVTVRVLDMLLPGQPVAGATVHLLELYSQNASDTYQTAVTDAQGVAALRAPCKNCDVGIVVTKGTRVSTLHRISPIGVMTPSQAMHLQTDRGMYKPGDTVHLSGVVATHVFDVAPNAPADAQAAAGAAGFRLVTRTDVNNKVKVTLNGLRSARVCPPEEPWCDTSLPPVTADATADANGVFKTSIVLPAEAQPGSLYVRASAGSAYGSASAEIADPRLPAFSLDAAATDPAASLLAAAPLASLAAPPAGAAYTYASAPRVLGAYMPTTVSVPVRVSVNASQLGGAGVKGAEVTVRATAEFQLSGRACESAFVFAAANGETAEYAPESACCTVVSVVECIVSLADGAADGLVVPMPVPTAVGTTAAEVAAAAAGGATGSGTVEVSWVSPANDALTATATMSLVATVYSGAVSTVGGALPGESVDVTVTVTRDVTLADAAVSVPVTVSAIGFANRALRAAADAAALDRAVGATRAAVTCGGDAVKFAAGAASGTLTCTFVAPAAGGPHAFDVIAAISAPPVTARAGAAALAVTARKTVGRTAAEWAETPPYADEVAFGFIGGALPASELLARVAAGNVAGTGGPMDFAGGATADATVTVVAPAHAAGRTAVVTVALPNGRTAALALPPLAGNTSGVATAHYATATATLRVARSECGALSCELLVRGIVYAGSARVPVAAAVSPLLSATVDRDVTLIVRFTSWAATSTVYVPVAGSPGLIAGDATRAAGAVRVVVAADGGNDPLAPKAAAGALAVVAPGGAVVLDIDAGAAAAGGTAVVTVVDAAVLQAQTIKVDGWSTDALTNTFLSYNPGFAYLQTETQTGSFVTGSMLRGHAAHVRALREVGVFSGPTRIDARSVDTVLGSTSQFITSQSPIRSEAGACSVHVSTRPRAPTVASRPVFSQMSEVMMMAPTGGAMMSMSARGVSADMAGGAAGGGAAGNKAADAGAGGASPVTTRTTFVGTAYSGVAALGKDGAGKVSFNVPDNVGRWEVRVLVVAPAGADAAAPRALAFGTGSAAFNSRRAISVQPVVPRGARVGDEYTAGVVVTPFDSYSGRVVVTAMAAYNGTVATGPDAMGALVAGSRQQVFGSGPAPSVTFAAARRATAGGVAVGGGAFSVDATGAAAAVVVQVEGGRPLRVMLPAVAARLGHDKLTVRVYAVTGADAGTDAAVARAAVASTVAAAESAYIAIGNGRHPREGPVDVPVAGAALVDVAEFDVEVLPHYPATALVSGFVVVPPSVAAADGDSTGASGVSGDTAERTEGLALPAYEDGAGELRVATATSWFPLVADWAGAAANRTRDTHSLPQPLTTALAHCYLGAYSISGVEAINANAAIIASAAAEVGVLSTAASDEHMWWAMSALQNAALCERVAKREGWLAPAGRGASYETLGPQRPRPAPVTPPGRAPSPVAAPVPYSRYPVPVPTAVVPARTTVPTSAVPATIWRPQPVAAPLAPAPFRMGSVARDPPGTVTAGGTGGTVSRDVITAVSRDVIGTVTAGGAGTVSARETTGTVSRAANARDASAAQMPMYVAPKAWTAPLDVRGMLEEPLTMVDATNEAYADAVVRRVVEQYVRALVWGAVSCPHEAAQWMGALGIADFEGRVDAVLGKYDALIYDIASKVAAANQMSLRFPTVAAVRQALSFGHVLSAAFSRNCSVDYSVTVADAIVWHADDVAKSAFSAEADKLLTHLWAPLRKTVRVQGRAAYIPSYPTQAWPMSADSHARLIGLWAAVVLRIGGSEAARGNATAAFSTDMVGRVVNHMVMNGYAASPAGAYALVLWDFATGSASSPDLEVDVAIGYNGGVAATTHSFHYKGDKRGPSRVVQALEKGVRSVSVVATGVGAATAAVAISFVPQRRETTTPTSKGIDVTRTVLAANSDGSWRVVTPNATLAVGTQLRVLLHASSSDYISDLAITDRVPVAVEYVKEEPAAYTLDHRDMRFMSRRRAAEATESRAANARAATASSLWWLPRVTTTYGKSDVTCTGSYARTVSCEYKATVTFAADSFWWPPARAWTVAMPEVFGEGVPLSFLAAVE